MDGYILMLGILFVAIGFWGSRPPRMSVSSYEAEFRSVRRSVLERDGHRCQHCGRPMYRGMHVHHIIYRSRGGTNLPSNLISLCPSCHGRIHGRRW